MIIVKVMLCIVFALISVGSSFAMKIDDKALDRSKDGNTIATEQYEGEVPSFKAKYNVIEEDTDTERKQVDQVIKAKEAKLLSKSPLSLSEDDMLWFFSKDRSYVDLFVRKKKGMGSIMLTNMYYGREYIKKYGSVVYGLRAQKTSDIGEREARFIDGKLVYNKDSYSFLVDSSPEYHKVFGLAFRVRIPNIVEYGYKSFKSNHGLITLAKGVTLNLRSYAKKYADNKGKFYNNPVNIGFTASEYNDRLKPRVTKISSYKEGVYNVVVVQYKSRINYIKNFLLRDFNKKASFNPIAFISPKEMKSLKDKDKKAYVVRAIRRKSGYVYITAFIYLKDLNYEQEYNIAAIDEENRTSLNYLSVILFPVVTTESNGALPKGDLIFIDNERLKGRGDGNEEAKDEDGRGEETYFADR